VSADDPIEQLFARGVTDGLPVVPPTRERVEAAIAASGLRADDLIALVAPAFGRATVEPAADDSPNRSPSKRFPLGHSPTNELSPRRITSFRHGWKRGF